MWPKIFQWKWSKLKIMANKETATNDVNVNVKRIANINPNIAKLEYDALRGPLAIRAAKIEKELEQGVKKPFTKVIRANISDCHALGQLPITFLRYVLALVIDPKNVKAWKYPADDTQPYTTRPRHSRWLSWSIGGIML